MQKDASRFFVAQAGPEIYEKNEMLKNRVNVFFVIHCISNTKGLKELAHLEQVKKSTFF